MESPNTACKTIHNINRLARRLAILTLIYSYDMLQHAYYPIAYTKQFCPTQILILNVIKSHSWTLLQVRYISIVFNIILAQMKILIITVFIFQFFFFRHITFQLNTRPRKGWLQSGEHGWKDGRFSSSGGRLYRVCFLQ